MAQFRLLDELAAHPSPAALPKPHDPQYAAHVLTDLQAGGGAAGPAPTAFIQHPVGQALLLAVTGNSPYLAQAILKDAAFFRDLAESGLQASFASTMGEVEALDAEDSEASLMAALRVRRRRVAVLTAIADIAGVWPLTRITGALSNFADAAVAATVRHLIASAVSTGAMTPEAARDHGFVVLAVGKLGGGELNYSSDIDLIALWDQEKAGAGIDAPDALFVRLTRRLVHILEDRTTDGYVFRTDLRLRPDPGSSPMALSMLAAETYYESVGQNWERAALIKARPIAGDIRGGAEFLDRIGPFIWRKHLDFAAIADIHSIKRQIHSHKGFGTIAVAGHNVKLGAGGIREIEFFAQTQQLIAGGRDPRLRVPSTCAAIGALAKTGRLGDAAAKELTDAYGFLRTLEHRIQMIGDEQTHVIPKDPDGLVRIATFMGFESIEAFKAEVVGHLTRVAGHYAKLFEQAPPLSRAGNLVFTGGEDDPGTLGTLGDLGFADARRATAIVRGWHHGRYRATHSARARALLTDLVPALLEAFGQTTDADSALLKFDEFLGNLPAGVQVFSLLLAHPELLGLIAEVMGSAPALAEALSRNPGLFDAVLGSEFADDLGSKDEMLDDLSKKLAHCQDLQDVLDESRRWTNDRKFQIGIQIMRGSADAPTAGSALSDLADSVMGALLPKVWEEFAVKHGAIPGSKFAVVAMGKLGAREMTAGSDLDLVFLYDVPTGGAASDGPAPLAESAYFARLGQRFISALSARTGEGSLYEVDMRLRPSGASGPIASSLDGWVRYQAENAWTFEHMALTRARVVAGPKDLAAEIAERTRAILCTKRDWDGLVRDVDQMRTKVETEHGSTNPWRVKYVRGGLVDVEFISQALQLRHASAHPEMLSRGTAQALTNLESIGALTGEEAEALRRAALLARNVQNFLRQCFQNDFQPDAAPAGLREALARACHAPNFAALESQLLETQAAVSRIFQTKIADPARG